MARGWYEIGTSSSDELVAAQQGVRVGCLTGLKAHGVWVPITQHPHLIVPRWGAVCGSGVQHINPRNAPWPRLHTTYDITACLRQVVRFHDVETALMVLESACNLELVSEETVREIIAECSPRLAKQLARFDPRAESGTETRVRLFLVGLGFAVLPQARIAGIGRVDLLVGRSLIIECDSHEHHTSEVTYQKDRRRDLRASALGHRVVRLTWEQVFLDWGNTKVLLLSILRTRGYRRPPICA